MNTKVYSSIRNCSIGISLPYIYSYYLGHSINTQACTRTYIHIPTFQYRDLKMAYCHSRRKYVITYIHTFLLLLDPFVINCLYILDWFKSLRPFSCSLRPFSCLLRPFSCLLRPFSCLQVSEHFDWLKQRLISHTRNLATSER